jgi:hypothetical protein
VRKGTRAKTVLTEASGHVEIDVPRDRDGSFEPQIVRKRQRRLAGVDEIVLSLYAKGLTTGEISAHFDEIYGASVSRETVSRITDRVLEEMVDWQNRPLDRAWCLGMVANVRERTFGCLAGHTTSCRHRSGSATSSCSAPGSRAPRRRDASGYPRAAGRCGLSMPAAWPFLTRPRPHRAF